MQLSYPIRLALAVVAAVASVAGGSSPTATSPEASPTAVRTVDSSLSRGSIEERAIQVAEIEGAVDARTTQLSAQSGEIAKAADDLRAQQQAAQAAAAQQAAQAAAAAAQQQAQGANPSSTDPRDIARQIMASKYGWGADQFTCFNNIIMRESKWSVTATNPSSGAYGIPQALPGSKMATVAADWRTNPATQIIWALGYVQGRYGTPCGAWAFKSANGWY
ncbi:MAG TPA: lytic transglycosylase domain-containing protein [Propionibacteriaceae bacterium]|nr:lytic transglycosylase domain-containing protein [Propionibacteriaceae bacterium]